MKRILLVLMLLLLSSLVYAGDKPQALMFQYNNTGYLLNAVGDSLILLTAGGDTIAVFSRNRWQVADGYSLPTSDGTANYVLKTDGSGVVSWAEDAGAAGGETNTASNVGNGTVGVFKQKTGSNLEFYTLAQGTNITLAIVGDSIVITAAGGGTQDFADVLGEDPDGGDINQTSIGKLEFFDAGLYLDASGDGVIDLNSDGTLELHSADWDISTTGVITNTAIDADNNTLTNIGDAAVDNNITINLATLATTVTVSDDESTNDAQEVVFTTDNANLESDGTFNYNPSTGTVTATVFAGTVTEVNNLETDGAVGITTTEVYIGTGAGTGAYAALSGDVTMDNAGDVTITSVDADVVLLNEIGDPGGNTSIAMGTRSIVWSFNTPVSEGFEILMGGNFTDHAFHVHQTTGNPSTVHLVHFESDDPDVLPLCVITGGRDSVAVFIGGEVFMDSLDVDGKATIDSIEVAGVAATGALDVTGNIVVSGTVDTVDIGALGGTVPKITDDTTNYQTAYTHSQDNTQAHSDYLRNDIADAASGLMTFAGGIIVPAPKTINIGGHLIGHDGISGFTFNDDIDVTGDIAVSGTVDGVDIAALAAEIDTLHFLFVMSNPNALYDTDVRFCFKPVLPSAITITRIDVTCDADPTTEPAMSLKYADAFIGLANAVTIDVITTTNGVTVITSGFDDATVPTGKALYFESLADPEAALKSITVDVAYTVD